ncbi:hypothetical protein MNV49_004309 [Pseudohyphozyma bogoriensis]|nr:hypothetical protein MNV49_004309 [Pseudohyphozyma bogoriensis]
MTDSPAYLSAPRDFTSGVDTPHHPLHTPLSAHFAQSSHDRKHDLPDGVSKHFSEKYNLPYWVDARNPAQPMSFWTDPVEDASQEKLKLDGARQCEGRPVARKSFSYEDHKSGEQPRHSVERPHKNSWLNTGAMGIGGMALGAFATHEWEKHQAEEAYQRGRDDELETVHALQAELERVRRGQAPVSDRADVAEPETLHSKVGEPVGRL